MSKTTMNLQDSFLNQVRKENIEIKLVMVTGQEMIGFVRGFDNFTVILNVRGSQHMVYKHAIAQIISRRSASRPDRDGRREAHHEGGGRPAGEGKKKTKAEESEPKKKFNSLDLSDVEIGEKSPSLAEPPPPAQ
jgi:host factor-I protein